MSCRVSALAVLLLATAAPLTCRADDASRQGVVRERSADVMPFELNATTHIFTKTSTGGVQRVVAKLDRLKCIQGV
jgi:hypothetical protein